MTLHKIYDNFLKQTGLIVQENLANQFKEIRNYLAGRVTGATRDETLVKELLKIIFCKIQDENDFFKKKTLNFRIDFGESNIETYKRIKNLYYEIKQVHPEIFDADDEINLDPSSVRFIVEKLQDYSLILCKRDPVGDAFEIFFGSHLRGSEGQFFTPRNVIELIVKMIDPRNNQTIIDPACGTGGFLSVSLNYLKNKNGFENLNEFYDDIEKTFFGIDKDCYLADLARKHIAITGNCNPKIICQNSLEHFNKIHFDHDTIVENHNFDIVITNPPFGSNIDSGSEDLRKKFEMAHKWKYDKKANSWEKSLLLNKNTPPQILFIERCLNLLKEGGRLGIILPESIFSSNNHRFVVNYLVANAKILAIISMPENLFKTSGKSGTHTKTVVLLAEKNNMGMEKGDLIFMADVKWCGHDSRGLPIPYDDLPKVFDRFKLFEAKKLKDYNHLGFQTKYEDIKDLIFVPKYYNPEIDEFFDLLQNDYNFKSIRELENEGIISLSTGDEIGKLSYGTGKIPFIRSSDISNWEIKVDPKQGVNEEIYEKYRQKQDVRPCDILLVRDGTYLIGTTAMITEYDKKILYQSHVFKIRSNKPKILDPYLLLALLSSDIVQKQIRAKQFSQDIIDSIGNRFYDVKIPLPNNEKIKNQIITDAKEVIRARTVARELLRKIRLTIASKEN